MLVFIHICIYCTLSLTLSVAASNVQCELISGDPLQIPNGISLLEKEKNLFFLFIDNNYKSPKLLAELSEDLIK